MIKMLWFLWFLIGAAGFAVCGGLYAHWQIFWGSWVLGGAFVWFALPRLSTWAVNGTVHLLLRRIGEVPKHLGGR
jgi:hypothetical protein